MSFLNFVVAKLNLHKQNIRRQNALTSTIIKHTTIHIQNYAFLHVSLTIIKTIEANVPFTKL